MLSTEEVRRVSVIVHQRRLNILIQQLGELGILHIIQKKSEISSPNQIDELILRDLEEIQQLEEKLRDLLIQPSFYEYDEDEEKLQFKGITIEDILKEISVEIEEIYENKQVYDENFNTLNNKLERLLKQKDLWQDLLNLNIDFSRIRRLKDHILFRIGYININNIHLFRKSLDKYPYLYFEKFLNEKQALFVVSSLQKYGDEIKAIESEYHTTMIENLDEIHLEEYDNKLKEIEEITKQLDVINEEISNFIGKNMRRLNAYREILNNLNSILRTEINFYRSAHFVTIEGWIPYSQMNYFMQICSEATENTALVFVSKKFDPEIQPPSKFDNNRVIRPFETITRLYGYPKYKEIDPTKIIFLTFPIIFGFMFGDIGHGLMLLIGGLLFRYLKRKSQGSWKNLSIIIAFCGICAIIAGFMYGEFFGMHQMFGIELEPILFNPLYDMMSGLKFSVIIGTTILSLGFALEGINHFIEKRRFDVFLTAIPKICIVVGGVYMVFTYKFQLADWFSGPLYILIVPAVVLVFGKMLVHLFSFSKIYPNQKNFELFGAGLLDGWETFLSFISNIPSFCRIFALSLVHIGLTGAILYLSDIANNVIFGSLLLIIGHVLVVLFEMLLAFVHSLRLHYYEFFGKFYQGTGSQFSPFTLRYKFSTVTFEIPAKID